uniref:Uncharacterized protein n=1 Tax=Nothoprocta perdicaria TaxID=30464 RepID=A0A8C6ZZX6_NOTPE
GPRSSLLGPPVQGALEPGLGRPLPPAPTGEGAGSRCGRAGPGLPERRRGAMAPPKDVVKIAVQMVGAIPQLIELQQSKPLAAVLKDICDA